VKDGKLHIALVGLRFGGSFSGIYRMHPAVGKVTLVDPDRQVRESVGETYGIANRAADLAQVLEDPTVDAVHLVTPIPLHARQSVQVLEAGKHCACTVPAATTIDELKAIVAAQKTSGKNYMMMETAVYTRQFLHALSLRDDGKVGRVQLLRGCHYQDMENWPEYWRGLPPMWYATHAVSPGLAFTGRRATSVLALGSGVMRDELKKRYANPFPAETAIFRIDGGEIAMEVTRTLFQVAREYTEGFCVYGEKMSVEWQYPSEEMFALHTMRVADAGRRGTEVAMEFVSPPDRAENLPPELRRFTRPGMYDDTNPQLSFSTGGGHHGSHPHLVHEYVSSIVEQRPPRIDAVTAADWTAAGICAHQSAMNGGREVVIPCFA
jgi:predicted dehydrogenase